MNQILLDNLPLWQFTNLGKEKHLRHYISGRSGGYSAGELGGLNLSYKVGDDPEAVERNRKALAKAFGLESSRLVFPVQTHSAHVKKVTTSTTQADLEDTDAIITNSKNIMISVMSADCVPVLLYDPVQGVVGAVHAGWRGTVARIAQKTTELMREEYGSGPQDLIAAIGPSICSDVYEVGKEVIEAVEKTFGKENTIITGRTAERGYCNLWEANRIQLLDAGLQPKNIEIAGICTYKHANLFFSARKSGNKAGRFAAGIMLV